VRQLVRYGSAREGAPTWYTTLILAEQWHVPPTEVHTMRGGVLWAARQSVLNQARKYWADFDKRKPS
jgi:hypothetical protein